LAKKPDLELGIRKVSRMNFSDIVTLPKPFTKKFLGVERLVKMSLSEDGVLRVIPIRKQEDQVEVDYGL